MEFAEPKSESDVYGLIRDLTGGLIYFERVEPANESGFPDTYFTFREGRGLPQREGTVELKFFKPRDKLDLRSTKFRGVQTTALMEYHHAGGNRRFVLAYHDGVVHVWDTKNAYLALQGKSHGVRSFPFEAAAWNPGYRESSTFHEWLPEVLA